MIDELGFDPDEPVAGVRSAVVANAAVHAARPSALSGALPRASELAGTLVSLPLTLSDDPTIAEIAAALALGSVAPARRGEEAVAVVRTASGRLYVLPDQCPHDGGPISDGFVEGERVVCARHGWELEACSGRRQCPMRGEFGASPVTQPTDP